MLKHYLTALRTSLGGINEHSPIRRHDRQQLLTIVLGSIAGMAVLLMLYDGGRWLLTSDPRLAFFVAADLVALLAMVALLALARTGRVRLAAYLTLGTLILLSVTGIPLAGLDRTFIVFAIPTLLASFLIAPVASLPTAALAIAAYSITFVISAPGYAYNYINVMALLVVATLGWQAARRLEHTLCALEERETRLQSIIEHANDAVMLADGQDRIIEWNKAAEEITGLRRDEWLGRTLADAWFEILPAGERAPDRRQALQAGMLNLRRSLQTSSQRRLWESEIHRFDGRVLAVQASSFLIDGRHETLMAAIVRDVTAQRDADCEVHHYLRRLEVLHQIDTSILAAHAPATIARAALANMRQIVPCKAACVVFFDIEAGVARLLAVDADHAMPAHLDATVPLADCGAFDGVHPGQVTDVAHPPHTTAVERMLQAEGIHGYAVGPMIVQDHMIGLLGLGLSEPGGLGPEAREITQEIANQLAVAIEQAGLRAARARHTEELESRVAQRTAELSQREASLREALQALSAANESLRAAAEKLQELDRLKSQFVSNVSHELRTPLTNIKLYLQLLEDGKPDRHARYMATLNREVDLLAGLIEDLLHLSRLDLGRTRPCPEPLDAGRLLTTIAGDRAELAARHGLTLETRLAPALPPVTADRRMLAQVLSNLITNATNYTPAGGHIVVGAELRPPWLTIFVQDTGLGIAPEEKERLFERFYRGSAARVSKAPGTGLGLPICQEIVTRHGGRITVDSEPGQGSIFTVWLPVETDNFFPISASQ